MKSYENIILLSDLDGTLLDSNSQVSKKNREAMADPFVIAEHQPSFWNLCPSTSQKVVC